MKMLSPEDVAAVVLELIRDDSAVAEARVVSNR
jgi:hypothetical protein